MKPKRKGSGKQILLRILEHISTNDIDTATGTEQLRSGLLLHGSTSPESFNNASKLGWIENVDEYHTVRRGIGLVEENRLLIEILRNFIDSDKLKELVMETNPDLSDSAYEAVIWAIWQLVASPTMSSEYLAIEEGCSEDDVEGYVANYIKKYNYHMQHYDAHGE